MKKLSETNPMNWIIEPFEKEFNEAKESNKPVSSLIFKGGQLMEQVYKIKSLKSGEFEIDDQKVMNSVAKIKMDDIEDAELYLVNLMYDVACLNFMQMNGVEFPREREEFIKDTMLMFNVGLFPTEEGEA